MIHENEIIERLEADMARTDSSDADRGYNMACRRHIAMVKAAFAEATGADVSPEEPASSK